MFGGIFDGRQSDASATGRVRVRGTKVGHRIPAVGVRQERHFEASLVADLYRPLHNHHQMTDAA